jgi:protein-S-isoprenylcysteine O-methyltransferase Ste14
MDTYVISKKKNRLCKTGVYALCRHPGVLWFIFLYVFLYCAFPSQELAVFSVTVSVMNILYVIFQDLWSFPRIFEQYDQYRRETPFLIPRSSGVRKCLFAQQTKEGKMSHESSR